MMVHSKNMKAKVCNMASTHKTRAKNELPVPPAPAPSLLFSMVS